MAVERLPPDPPARRRPRWEGDPRSSRGAGATRQWWIEVLVVLVCYEIYEWTRDASPSHPGLAIRNGRAIWHFEQWLHVNPERVLNHAIGAVPPLAVLSGYYYLALHFAVPIGLLVWLFRRRPAAYGRLRWILLVSTTISLVFFWFLPVAPPRFVVAGMTDTVATSHIIGAAYQSEIAPHANLYAAMPSLHVTWAAWCAMAVLLTCGRRWVRVLSAVYPLATTADIIATANHFVADAVGGLALLAVSSAVVLGAETLARRSVPKPVSIRKQ